MLNANHTIAYLKGHLILIMIATWSFWWPSCSAYKLANAIHINPNIRCPGKNEQNIWHPCKHGGYIQNPDPKNCDDRYVCYVGLNETCRRGDKCTDNAICTVCGICQKCDNPQNCSDFNLCPMANEYSTLNLIKRLMQKRFMELNDQ